MTDEELKEEMYQDMLQEAREEECRERMLRTDYDYFISHIDPYIYTLQKSHEELIKASSKLEAKFEEYGWAYNMEDFL